MGISHINISRGNIIDRLPDWFNNSLSNVEVLDISGNQIIGALPTNMETNMSLSKPPEFKQYNRSNTFIAKRTILLGYLKKLFIRTSSIESWSSKN